MTSKMRRESDIASATRDTPPFTITMSAFSTARSLPAPMATPMSAPFRAAASLIPSPAIITLRPRACQSRTRVSLSSGRRAAR